MDAANILSGICGGLGSGGLLMFVLKNMKSEIKTKVSGDMCEQKHSTVNKGLEFLLDKCRKQDEKHNKDHDVLIQITTTLSNIEAKVDKLNNADGRH